MIGWLLLATAGWTPQEDVYAPFLAPASDEAERAIATFKVLPGLEVELFAAEPMVANPVVLYVDHQSRVFVAETFRHHRGVTDVREHMDWLDNDLANESVAERVEMFRRFAGDRFPDYSVEHERIRQLVDTDGDGKADRSTVYADGFNDPAAGIAAGLLARGDELYYTCIPDLWLLKDVDQDGVADERKKLSSGYGIHVALLGHDLHALRIGPDGRLYFSSGDRGFSVETENGRIHHPDTGAVLRCELDGSNLEVYHTGLRNPQELAFDDWGRLFTGDNNSDGGDKARWVQVVEGAESGWRYAYQWLTEPMRGPWNQEKLWHPRHAGQAAYILPPIANLADGPSGLTYYPGTGFGEAFDGHFLLSDFRGALSISGIHLFDLIPRGASFELGEVEFCLSNSLVTDCDFGPDGRLYITDWVNGWNTQGKGRVHRMFDPQHVNSELVRETHKFLSEGMSERPIEELAGLMAHVDQRIRNEAHWELAGRGLKGAQMLARVGASAAADFSQLHALFGLSMSARLSPEHRSVSLPAIAEATEDPDGRIRAQAVRALGELGHGVEHVRKALADKDDAVRLEAGIAIGKLADPEALPEVVSLITSAGDDPYLRHAGVQGLLGCADEAQLADLAELAPEQAVRLAAVVALRRLQSEHLAGFVADADPLIASEAARAVYDLPIESGLPALAGLISGQDLEPVVMGRRILGANFRLGTLEHARALRGFASRANEDSGLRVEALRCLAEWEHPQGRDRVVGAWRPLEERPPLPGELAGELGADAVEWGDEAVLSAWIAWAATSAPHVGTLEALERIWSDETRVPDVRVDAFTALAKLDEDRRVELVDRGMADGSGEVRAAAFEWFEQLDSQAALERIPGILATGEYRERRVAYRLLGSIEGAGADEIVANEIRRLAVGEVASELALDLTQAGERRGSKVVSDALAALRAARTSDPVLSDLLDVQFGGDGAKGAKVFERVDLSCVRCHGQGESQRIGPDLAGVGRRLTRLQLLESIADPNRHIARGYQSTVFFLTDGAIVDGLVLEDGELIRIVTAEGELVEFEATLVEDRRSGLSAMPEGLAKLMTPEELRDLMEYLSDL